MTLRSCNIMGHDISLTLSRSLINEANERSQQIKQLADNINQSSTWTIEQKQKQNKTKLVRVLPPNMFDI